MAEARIGAAVVVEQIYLFAFNDVGAVDVGLPACCFGTIEPYLFVRAVAEWGSCCVAAATKCIGLIGGEGAYLAILEMSAFRDDGLFDEGYCARYEVRAILDDLNALVFY